jgi:hypothetical protein
MAGPLTYLIPASRLRRDVRIYGNALPDGRATAWPLDNPFRVQRRDRQGARSLLHSAFHSEGRAFNSQVIERKATYGS